MKNLEQKILDLAIKLIKIPSVTKDKTQTLKCIKLIEEYFKNTNVLIEKYKKNGYVTLIVKNFKGKKADIILNGHIDVVPSSQDSQFKPVIKKGWLFGRGSADMKNGIAIITVLMKNLMDQYYKDKKIALIITSDEEVGGVDGMKYIVDEKGYNGKVALIPDSRSKGLDYIVYSQKGVIHLNVISKGKSCHASRRRSGDNAIDKLIKFYSILRQNIEDENLLIESNDYRSSTVNLTNISGGNGNINVIPDYAEGKIDIRFSSKYSLKKLLNKINLLAKKIDGINIKIVSSGDLLHSSEDNYYLNKYLKISSHVLGKQTKLSKEHGASDGRFLSSRGGVVILHNPEVKNCHGKNECSKISDIIKIYNIYEKYIKDIKI